MSTRSAIGYKMDTSKVRAKYCHWDGYVENNGKILEDNYQEARKVAQLRSRQRRNRRRRTNV